MEVNLHKTLGELETHILQQQALKNQNAASSDYSEEDSDDDDYKF